MNRGQRRAKRFPYKFRNLPYSIQPDEKLWCVSGSFKHFGSGVLEWCYNKQDAEEVLASMKQDERFVYAHVEKWTDAMRPQPSS